MVIYILQVTKLPETFQENIKQPACKECMVIINDHEQGQVLLRSTT